MALKRARAWRWAAGLGLSLFCVATVRSQSRIGVYKLAADSPLATDGRGVFAVADNGYTLLYGSGSSSDWEVLAKRPTPGRIKGLAFARVLLYLSDDKGVVYAIPRGAATAQPLARGTPLVQPSELAVVGGNVLVADPGARAVFRIGGPRDEVEPLVTGLPIGPLHVAAERDAVVITSPDSGEIREPVPFEHGSVVQKGPADFNLSVWRTREPVASSGDASPNRRFPLLQKPGPVTVARGNVYVVDVSGPTIYVTYRQQSRPVQVVGASNVQSPRRTLVVGDTLFVLDGSRGVLEPTSLPVPTEFDLGREPDLALENVYQFLIDNHVLPTRSAPWKGSWDSTLRAAGVGFGEFSPTLEFIVCLMNDICGRPLPAGSTIKVPDVPIESVIDFETIRAEDLRDGTLGELVDRKVLSPAFADRKSDRELWELNTGTFGPLVRSQRRGSSGSWTPNPDSVRKVRAADLPKGTTLTIPVERVRCLAALPRNLLRDERQLSRLRSISPGFNWAPLEDVEATAYSASPQDPPSPAPTPPPCDMQAVKQSLVDMRKAISYRKPDGLQKVRVAVAEEKGVDVTHPDFGGRQRFAFLSPSAQPTPASTAAATPTPTPSPSPSPAAPPGCDARPVDEAHGTGVAGLIAGSGALSGIEALAPNVEIVPIRTSDKLISDDIASAFGNRRVKIFNLSLHYRDQLVTHIRRQIRELRNEALFVVSAGNDPTDGKPVCDSDRPYPAYPVCEGWRTNVLVVAATNLAGDALIEQAPTEPGSNWDERVVSVAAPGTGYWAPGRNGGYQLVRGTSFATPLVTATAAMLAGQGISNPWLIKQRIIATADPKNNLRAKVVGGLLNVGRAVTAPSFSVLTDTHGTETVVELEDDLSITFTWEDKKASRTIPLRSVRRLTRTLSGQTYRIVYLDDATGSLVIREEIAPGPWPFAYQKVDAAGNRGPNVERDSLENYKDYVGPVS